MDRAAAPPSFGHRLRGWRLQRGLSQLALALQAGVSTRHLSWLEGGKAEPSRAMVLRLSARLDLPLRERNALLLAAGYAPMYAERALSHPALGTVLQRLLDAHEPWPALAVDRHWNLVASNRLPPLLLQAVAPELRTPPVNVLRATLHPRGLAPMIEQPAAWRAHVLARLQRQAASSADPVLAALHAELRALPFAAGAAAAEEPACADAVAVPLVLNTPHGRLSFITTVTVFGAPHDVLLSELAVETLLPTDEATAGTLRGMLAAG